MRRQFPITSRLSFIVGMNRNTIAKMDDTEAKGYYFMCAVMYLLYKVHVIGDMEI